MALYLQISNPDENQFLPNANPLGTSVVAKLHTKALAVTGIPSALDIANTEELNYFFRPVQAANITVTPPPSPPATTGVHDIYFCHSNGSTTAIQNIYMCHANGSVTNVTAYFGSSLMFQY
jgi:hypothetical protein